MLKSKKLAGFVKFTADTFKVEYLNELAAGDVLHIKDANIIESLVSKWATENDKEVVILSNDRLYRKK